MPGLALIQIKLAIAPRPRAGHLGIMIELKGVPTACAHRRSAGDCAHCAARPFSVCASLADSDLVLLDALAEHVTLAAGEPLFHQGDAARHVFNVTSGCVRISRLLADGRRQITGFLFAGDFIGLSAEDERAFTVEAVRPATLCRFRRADYRALMDHRRELQTALLERAGNELSAAQAQIVTLGRKTAVERLASFLLHLAGRDPFGPQTTALVRLPMTRGDIADYLGLTLETVSRAMGRLKAMGLITQISLEELRVDRPDGLRELAAGA